MQLAAILLFVAVALALPVTVERDDLANITYRGEIPKGSPSFPKRGLPFNNPPRYSQPSPRLSFQSPLTHLVQNWNGKGSQVNWAYNWDSSMPGDFPRYMEFIPMLHSNRPEHTNPWFANANSALARGSGHLLSFNEPDACGWGQACMSPQAAVDAYRKYMMPFTGRCSLGAPAVTNGAGGLSWLREFLRLCGGCQVNFVPIHWYDSATNFQYFYNYIGDANAAAHSQPGPRDLWVTEAHPLPLSLSHPLQLTKPPVQRPRQRGSTNPFPTNRHAVDGPPVLPVPLRLVLG
jgi:hypothetical protein